MGAREPCSCNDDVTQCPARSSPPVAHSLSAMNMLPKPGETLHVDYRDKGARATGSTDGPSKALRLVQWNIERGLQLQPIIEHLRELDADIIALQEVDIGCERSGRVDAGAVIAHELKYQYLFVCEFEELWSPVRDAASQGGGVHGNAILSRYDISSWTIIEHSHHPVDWNDQQHPRVQKEPRNGRRLSLAADICTPLGTIRVYTCHLEVFCGMLSRMCQFADIMVDAKRAAATPLAPPAAAAAAPGSTAAAAGQAAVSSSSGGNSTAAQPNVDRSGGAAARPVNPSNLSAAAAAATDAAGSSSSTSGSTADNGCSTDGAANATGSITGPSTSSSSSSSGPMQAILGDLNTMAHGIARLSPDYCCDAMRWRSLGCSEAAYWQRHLLSYFMPGLQQAEAAGPAGSEQQQEQQQLEPLRPYLSKRLLQLGLPEEVCAALLNPGFADPFDVDADATLDNPKYKLLGVSLMKGKLDWMLLRGLQVVAKGIGNHDYSASDHKWLCVDVRPAAATGAALT